MAPEPDAQDPEGEGDASSHTDMLHLSLFAGVAFLFLVFACWMCKRRRAEERVESGSQQARKLRKNLPLTEEDPNRSLLEAQERQKEEGRMQFITNVHDEDDG